MWLFCFGSGSIFSDQSRWTVRAERAPGSPALMGDNGGHGSATPVQSPVLAFLAQCKKGVPARACVAAASRWAVVGFGADEVVATLVQDDAHGGFLVVERVGDDEGVGQLDLGIGQEGAGFGDLAVFLFAAGHGQGHGASVFVAAEGDDQAAAAAFGGLAGGWQFPRAHLRAGVGGSSLSQSFLGRPLGT